jgi:hypothetical protein
MEYAEIAFNAKATCEMNFAGIGLGGEFKKTTKLKVIKFI